MVKSCSFVKFVYFFDSSFIEKNKYVSGLVQSIAGYANLQDFVVFLLLRSKDIFFVMMMMMMMMMMNNDEGDDDEDYNHHNKSNFRSILI